LIEEHLAAAGSGEREIYTGNKYGSVWQELAECADRVILRNHAMLSSKLR
jgi:hypothetical protein